jgi:tRNA(fMet)-specific endonuclease VapC
VINYMLDTNACIHVITGRVASVRERLQAIPPEQIGISAVVVAELQFGINLAAPTRRETNQQALDRFLEMVAVEDWPAEAAALYGEQRAALRRLGQPIGANDLLIGCHALHRQRVLVTQNQREFERLQGLSVEDWSGSSSGA